MQMYPGWSARDNYAQNKKKSRKQQQRASEKNSPNCTLNSGQSMQCLIEMNLYLLIFFKYISKNTYFVTFEFFQLQITT